VVPGAVLATGMWFLTTLAFGWYVTRFANYSEVYGSLGAGIALLFWLYIVSLCVLCGAEFNAQFANQLHAHFGRWQERRARRIGARGDGSAQKLDE
jgi:membrane protein